MSSEIKICSSLEKIFPSDALPPEYSGLTLLKNERGSVQFAVRAAEDGEIKVAVDSPLPCALYVVRDVPVGLAIYENAENCTVLNGGKSGDYPDILTRYENGAIKVQAGRNTVIWAEFTGSVPGEHKAVFTVSGSVEQTAEARITVSAAEIAEQKLKHINWFHSDCLSTYYNVEVFSEDYWRITENFMKNAAAHGVNTLLTPVFTPPLDTEVGSERPTVQLVDVTKKGYTYTFGFEKLDRWIDTAFRSGIKYFEISHFFTQWGAEHAPKIMAQTSSGYRRIFGWETNSVSQGYMSFLRQFGEAFKKYTDEKGITDLCLVHCSDEPSISHITRYRKTSDALRKYFPAYKHIDALSDIDFYRTGLIDLPVPGEQEVTVFAKEVPSLWTYYCCGQFRNELPNRFICFPSIRTRILGVLLYKYGCDGFLQWGYNFYYSQLSRYPIDPYKVTDAGGAFPAGDAFIVYPGKDGTPVPSLRQKVFYDGIQDISALNSLEKLTSREYVLGLIKEELGDITFNRYPFETSVFLKFRERVTRETNNKAAW